MNSPKPVSGWQRSLVIWLDKRIYGLAKNWLAIFNIAMFLYVGLPFAAPMLMKVGATVPANLIYTAYSPLCHQFGFRSWFLFGEKAFYEASDPVWKTVGIDPFDLVARFKAKAFVGNEQMGFKVAYCERDVAIYGAIVIGGILYGFARMRGIKIRPVNIFIYALVGLGPIALDGFSQLFSQAPFYWLPVRESTPYLRTLTGFLFGIMNVWLAYPYVEESFTEIKADLEAKLIRIGELTL
jgi:uncharacterized membrane protein